MVAELNDRDTEEGRRLHVHETLPGQWWIDGRCTAVQAEVLNRAVDALMAGWLRDGSDTRTVAQMRVDALVEVCRQWLTFGETPTVRDERPHINVNVDLDSLLGGYGLGLFDNANPVPGDVLSEFMCDCVLTRIMSRGSLVLDVGRSERLVTPAQRKAVVRRDRCCRFPGCGRPPSQCDVHHVVDWAFKHGNDEDPVYPNNDPPAIMSDIEMRQRIRDAIRRFQATTAPTTRHDAYELNRVRERVRALSRLPQPLISAVGPTRSSNLPW